ncbi:GDP-D-glucose phosphorylase 1 [Durusdinium trenchii]|uniref:GDP-D-glucose phosphorylase 1 n=1 Tax=Durusdinium trenchii TaxID=1381693 RepID=A0ABP0RGY7_9DINO
MFQFCCSSRDAKSIENEKKDFDEELLDGFAWAERSNLLRSSPSSMLRRKLDGDLEVWVHFSPDYWAKKRKPETRPMEGTGPASSSVLRPVDPEAFNFTKINEQEVLKDALEVGSWSVSVLACISPLCFGHVLFVPDRAKLRPQALTTELISCGLQLLTASKRSDFRVVFNSMSGFASVNHFHYHGLFLDHAGLKRLPVEYMSRSRVAGDRTEGKLCCELLVESWFCRGLILSAGAKEGEPPEGAADLDALTDFAGRVVQFLQEKNLAHNVMFVPYLGERIKPLFDPYEVQDVPPPRAASPEIYIFPRKPEGDCREERTEDPGFNAAICEMSGLLFAHDEQRFNSFDEDQVAEIFKQDVSMDGHDFDDLICKVAWMIP